MTKYFLAILSFIPIIGLSIGIDSGLFVLTNWIISGWSIYRIYFKDNRICRARNTFNCNTMLYFFVYFFFCIAPLYQFSHNISIWGGRPLTSTDYIIMNLVIILALVTFEIFYFSFASQLRPCRFTHNGIVIRQDVNILMASFLSVFSTLFTIWMYRENPVLLFLREVNLDGHMKILEFEGVGNSAFDLIFSIFIRPIPIVVLIFANLIRRHSLTAFKLFLLVLIFISNFPLALARFYVAALYIPLLFSFLPSLLTKHSTLMKAFIIVGVMFIFPFLNQGRSVVELSDVEFSFMPNYSMFGEGHFDAFQNGANVVSHGTITYGKQLMGALFFFVPRSVWPDKPIGSGGFIAERYDFFFDHISLNYWAEGYINFGILGVVLFSVILAFMHVKLEYMYMRSNFKALDYTLYVLYIGTLFFFLRGDLISSIAYLIGLFSCAYFVNSIIVKTHKL